MILLLVISPITLFIAIFRYQFLDIQIIIKRSFVYGFVFTLLIAVYAGIVQLLTQFIKLNTEQLYHIPDSIAAIIIVILFLPVRNYVQTFVDRKFFKVAYDFKMVQQQFLSQINNCLTLKEISELLIKTINENIPVESTNFFIYSKTLDDLEILAENNNHMDQNQNYQIKENCKQNNSKLPIAKRKALMDDISYIDKSELLKDINSEIIFMSFTEDMILINVLVLGKKKSGLSFTTEDISMLRFFTVESGNAFQRLGLQRELLFHQEEIIKLEELNKLKSYFVSSVSHELKTPLTSIKLFAEIINIKKNLSIEQREDYLEIIQGECERLNRLVDNILDFGKIERGAKDYKFEIVNLNNIVDSAINTLNYLLKLKKFNLIYIKNEDEYNIIADADALTEVFINLIDNSIKYSTDIKEISIKTFQLNNKYCFQISDKGIGISDAEQEKIFDSFYRSNDTNVKATGGAGIGLSLVKQIMNAHKGYIELDSKIGHGSTFKLYFPKSD
jgi:signal transduction histidine kinase